MIIIATGSLVLAGWVFDWPNVQQVLPGLPKMTANTAIAFILAGISLWQYAIAGEAIMDRGNHRRLAQTLALLVTLLALLTLSEYLFNWDAGLDQLLLKDQSPPAETTIPGRPSPHTALTFTLIGISLLLIHNDSPRRHWLAQYLTLTAAFVALLALVGYSFSIPFLFRISAYTGMALHTALAFIVLCTGLLFLHPDRSFMALMTGANLGGVMARRLLLVSIAVPLLIGWFSLWGKRAGLYDAQFEPVLLAVLSAYVYSGAIWWYAHSLNQLEADREQAVARFRLVVEASPNAITLVDSSGKISLVNDRTETLFGYARDALLGRPIEMLVPAQFRSHHSDYRNAFFTTPTARPMGAGRDLFGLHQDGTQVPIEIGLNPITTAEGDLVLASIIDITERKQAEAKIADALQREQAARIKSEAAQQRLAFLAQASTILASSLNYHLTLAAVAQLAVPQIADWCAFDVLEPTGSLRRVAAAHTDPSKVGLIYDLQPHSLPDLENSFGIYHFPTISQTQSHAEVSQDFMQAANLSNAQIEIICSLGVKSIRIVPMLAHGQALGIITFAAGATTPPYNKDYLTLSEELASRAALAVENAQLYRESQNLNEELEQRVAQRTAQLEAANKELEAFSYSVSHDLRAPLRSIDGFSQALLEDYGDSLDNQALHYLERVRAGSQRMAQLIDDLLMLSRLTRSEMRFETVALSALAWMIATELQQIEPDRQVEFIIAPDITVAADKQLIRVALENLFNNAWKFTAKHATARVEFGVQAQANVQPVYFLRDDGAGFDMAYANKLFGAFQRLHTPHEFPGTGIGLAIVQRIIHRHGGRIWAKGAVEAGASFYFTLNSAAIRGDYER